MCFRLFSQWEKVVKFRFFGKVVASSSTFYFECLEEDLNLRPKELVMKKAKLFRIWINSLNNLNRFFIPPNRTCDFHRIRLFVSKELLLAIIERFGLFFQNENFSFENPLQNFSKTHFLKQSLFSIIPFYPPLAFLSETFGLHSKCTTTALTFII